MLYLKQIKAWVILLLFSIVKLPLHFLYFLSGFYPRNKNIWIFGGWNGKYFRGNSKYLFSYILEKYPDIEIIWLTKDEDLYNNLKREYKNIYKAYSLTGFIYTLRARYFFVTHGILDINEYASKKGILINMSHSIYPIKDMNLYFEKWPLKQKIKALLSIPYGVLIKPDIALTSSEYTAVATAHHYNIKDFSKIKITGVPKTDFLISSINKPINISNFNENKRYFDEDKKRILFLPTWRKDHNFSLFRFGFNAGQLSNTLIQFNGVIGFNYHPSTIKYENNTDLNTYNNIVAFNYSGDQINQLLSRVDLLITDYSALFADFLIYDKPIIFAKFDHSAYIKSRGLFLDYDSLPGAKAETWPEILVHIKNIFVDREDEYLVKRKNMRNLIYQNADGNACERIVQEVMNL